MKEARKNQLSYLFLGIIMVPLGIYINYPYIARGEFPVGVMTFFLGTGALMMAYLSPHLFPKDERTKEIIGKSMTANYFTLFATITLLFITVADTLSGSEVLTVLFCIMVTSIPLTMIYYSKRI
ncbi:hypothetical protein MKZ25_10805 [Solibacillus sp. FSL W7-1464]|uniref:hypothetical protein n=1 Tax=Solibacillus sp. FSL W7-1464 TaxID=2921706 RepID=UPI0030FA8463